MACIVVDGAQRHCTEFVQPKSDDMKLAIRSHCRESGGTIYDACPAEHVAGGCESAQDLNQAWTLSAKLRGYEYGVSEAEVPAITERLKSRCLPPAVWIPPGKQ
jgi:hypothetical protein